MRSIQVRFTGSLGHELVGRLELPDEAPSVYAVHAACFTCVKDLKAARWLSARLTEHGVGVLRFDYTGLGESRGSFAEVTLGSKVGDVVAAADFLTQHHREPAILTGHSIGGAAALIASTRLPAIRLVATINSPSATGHLAEMIRRRAPDLENSGPQPMSFAGGRAVPVSHALMSDLEEQDLARYAADVKAAALIFQSTGDQMLGLHHAERLFSLLPGARSYIALPDADHLLLRSERDAHFIADVIAAWWRGFGGMTTGE